MRVIYPFEAKKYDEEMIKNGIPSLLLMEQAAMHIANAAEKRKPERVVVFAGIGGNGGDGFSAARQLESRGIKTKLYFIGDKAKAAEDTKTNMAFFEKQDRIEYIESEEDVKNISILKEDVVIDALFGTGLKRDVSGIFALAIKKINESPAYVISTDIASGINAENGQIMGEAIKANETITFVAPKPGHFIYPGREHTGKLLVYTIAPNADVFESDITAYPSGCKELYLEKRKKNSHKGTYGYLGIIGAQYGMSGASIFAAKGAQAAGAGVINILSVEKNADIFARTVPFAVLKKCSYEERYEEGTNSEIEEFIKNKAAIAVGCGMGSAKGVRDIVRYVYKNAVKCVIDADGINVLSISDVDEMGENVVLTPHPKEFSRLTGMSVDDILKDPINAVLVLTKRTKATILLKGATTVIATGEQISLVLAGSPAMAKGGSGDVLTGIISAFLAQGYDAHKSALLGAYIAGMAGEKSAEEKGEYSASPDDTIANIPFVIKEMIR